MSLRRIIPSLRFASLALVTQIVFLIVFGVVVDYDPSISAATNFKLTTVPAVVPQNSDVPFYHYLKDVSVMMFVGFGFLMAFLRKYGYSSIGYNFFLAALVLQWAIIMNGTRTSGLQNGRIYVGLRVILEALLTVCSVLISFGAVLGKLNLTQLLFMAICEVPIIVWNEYLGKSILWVVDTGDSIYIHCFGAFFGLGVAAVMYRSGTHQNESASANYISDIFSMVGTLFLWIYWPSFNGGVEQGSAQGRALVNTILALTGSVMGSFFAMAIVPQLEQGAVAPPVNSNHTYRYGRFNMVYLQNATIAGGVAVGSCCAMMVSPCLAIFIGWCAGVCSVIGFRFVTPYVNAYLHDTCGVHNLHGFPSFIAAIASAVTAALAYSDKYADELYYVFPAMSPAIGTQITLRDLAYTTKTNLARTQFTQGGFQIAGWLHTFIISLVSGVVVGLVLRYAFIVETPDEDVLFDDVASWDVAERMEA